MQSTNFKISTSPHQVLNSCLLIFIGLDTIFRKWSYVSGKQIYIIRNIHGQIINYAFVSKGSHDVSLNPCIQQ